MHILPKVVIFDWDGTLMDSVEQIVNCLMLAANELKLPLQAKAAQDIIGLSLPKAMTLLFPDHPEMHQTIIEHYAKHFVQSSADPRQQSTLFADALTLLDFLKNQGCLIAIATGKSRVGLVRIFEQTGIEHYFAATRTADETASKPDPLMLKQILEQLSVKASDCLMIGDSIYDLQMANNAAMPCLGVTHGVHSASELATQSPLMIADSLADVLQWFKTLAQ